MYLHRNLVEAAIDALQTIFEQGALADKTIAGLLQSRRQWGSRDRRFVAQTIYDALRWYRLWAEIGGAYPAKSRADWWRILAIGWWTRGEELPDWPEFQGLDVAQLQQRQTELQGQRAVQASIPDWLDARGLRELGELPWQQALDGSNQPAPLIIRTNTLLLSSLQLLEQLRDKGIECEPIADSDAIWIKKHQPLESLPAFQKGFFEIQDGSSQRVVPFVDAAPGQTVLDVCAGGGGKSLHLAAQMRNRGKIIALDIRPQALRQLEQRAKRAQVRIIETRPASPQGLPLADRILLDAPCSGLGTLRRQVDKKWKLTEEFVDKIIQTQQGLLQQYAPLLKQEGALIYATCSILPSENQAVVRHFLASEIGQGFYLESEQAWLPNQEWGDGFYMARLLRKN